MNESEILIYTTEDGLSRVDVTFDGDTVWLNQDQMAELFQKAKSTINEHIKHIYEDGELQKSSTMRKFGNTEFSTAKNYLDENELKIMNRLVSGYFDLAEINAIEHRPMYMSDYIEQLDAVLSSGGRKLLSDAGKISHYTATEKAKSEYRKYQEATLSPVEVEYLKTIKNTEKQAKKEAVKSDK